MGRVLRLVLTDWLASDLVEIREAEVVPAADSLHPEEAAEVRGVVVDILRDLPDGSLSVLKYKYAGLSDQEIATRLNISRPTVAKRKDQALAVLRRHLDGERDLMRDAIVSELGLQMARSE
jgi:DNA-directed RNA polymerase specialized sigma24 family protein